eukprot:7089432-Heterocapsa_arctica.AAC.1
MGSPKREASGEDHRQMRLLVYLPSAAREDSALGCAQYSTLEGPVGKTECKVRMGDIWHSGRARRQHRENQEEVQKHRRSTQCKQDGHTCRGQQ